MEVVAWVVAVAGMPTAAPVPADAGVPALVRRLETGSPGEKVIAAELLGDLGPAAADAAPALAAAALKTRFVESIGQSIRITSKADEFLYNACVTALRRIGPKADVSVAKLLDHEERFARELVLFSFHDRTFAPAAVPGLVRFLTEGGPDAVGMAADALGAMGPAAADAIPDLVALFLRHRLDRQCSPGPFIMFGPHPRVAAVRALVRIGPKAGPALRKDVLPVVIDELKAGAAGWDVLAETRDIGAAAVPAVAEYARKQKEWYYKTRAAAVLPGLGPDGRKAFAALAADKDAAVRRAVVLALAEQSPEFVADFVPQLLEAIRKGESADRAAAVAALARLGAKAPPRVVAAVEELLKDRAFLDALGDRGSNAVLNFVYTLPELGPESSRLLYSALDAPNAAVRHAAVKAFLSLNSRAKAALPALRRVATEDADVVVAAIAAVAAANLSADPADLGPLFARGGLRSRDPKVFNEVVQILSWTGRFGEQSRHELAPPREPRPEPEPEDVGALIEKLRRVATADDPGETLDRVARLGPAAVGALPVLVELIPDLDASQAHAVMGAVAAIGVKAKDAVPAVVKRLAGADDDWRVPAALCLAEIGPAAKAAVPALEKVLAEPDPDLRLAAAYALARIAGDPAAFRAAFARTVEREIVSPAYPSLAAELFERSAPHVPELLPIVVRGLERGWSESAAVAGVAKFGAKAESAVPALRKVLAKTDATTDEQTEAIRALVAIGPAAREAIPDLRRLAELNTPPALPARDAIAKLGGKK